MSRCQFVPPYLLEKIAASHPDANVGDCTRSTLQIDEQLRSRRREPAAPAAPGDAPFAVHTAHNGSTLPGELVRSAGDAATGDQAVDEAYVGVEASLALFSEVFGRSSYDDRGAPVIATVHYEQDYDNAFWDGTQLVFGDGDGQVFDRFTKPVDVLGHELSHAVTQFSADLTYEGQSGALNESVSDVFGSCLKQRLLGESVEQADWLIGEGLFLPSVQGVALRSMAAPGTAYDDPVLGKDPQVAHMDDFVVTDDDNGGVHTNSGIPNKAFHLAATGLGGTSWDGAGKIWYAALTSGIGADTDFAGFAAATVTAAEAVSPETATTVRDAWQQVGVTASSGGAVGSRALDRALAGRRDPHRRVRGGPAVRRAGPGRGPAHPGGRVAARTHRRAVAGPAPPAARPVRLRLRPRRRPGHGRRAGPHRRPPPARRAAAAALSVRRGLTVAGRGAPCAAPPGREAGSPARRC